MNTLSLMIVEHTPEAYATELCRLGLLSCEAAAVAGTEPLDQWLADVLRLRGYDGVAVPMDAAR